VIEQMRRIDPQAQPVIATRTFKAQGRRKLTAVLCRPIRVRASPEEWVAGFRIEGLAEECTGRSFGIDGLQAVLLAAQALRNRMEGLDVGFSWLGGEQGDTGIPPAIPTSLGFAFTKMAEDLISREVSKLVRVKPKRAAKGRRASRTNKSRPRRLQPRTPAP
jgi:hypothetical protein